MRINLKQTSKHVSCLLRNVVLESVDASQDEAVKFLDAPSLEWDSAIQHGEKNYTSAPKINVEAVSVFVLEDLRSYVSGSSALFAHLDAWSSLLADSKVSDLD